MEPLLFETTDTLPNVGTVVDWDCVSSEFAEITIGQFRAQHLECQVSLVYGVRLIYDLNDIISANCGKMLAVVRAEDEETRYYWNTCTTKVQDDCPCFLDMVRDFSEPGTSHWEPQEVFPDIRLHEPDAQGQVRTWETLIPEVEFLLAANITTGNDYN